jgi:uncharacterized damage-inducible protein DinB
MEPPELTEAAPYYFTYINRVASDNIVGYLDNQLEETHAFLSSISEEKSLYRYAPDKWSIRQLLNHVNDCERTFLFRAFWFARVLEGPLPSLDQNVASGYARADEFFWASHIEEFRVLRLATIAFFRNLPAEAWMRTGTASGYSFTVNALAYILAGHVAHHKAILEERYL